MFDASNSADPEGRSLEYRWDFDNDGIWDTEWSANPTAFNIWYDEWVGEVKVEVSDGQLTDTSISSVTVGNVAPTVNAIGAPSDPVPVNTLVMTTAAFTDPGVLDTHVAVWEWGDGTASAGIVNEVGGSGTVSGSHTYGTPGVYTIVLAVTDDDGGTDSHQFQYVVVYDPEGGFVTGGGWIVSPEGAYAPDPSLTGRATFGFVSKYTKGASTPSGNTEFMFHVADLQFKSTSYDWLIVAGAKAQYKGSGTINGAGDYGFMLTATDGQINGGGGSDMFRIKIWDKTTGNIIYDNQMGAADDANPTMTIAGGSIVIHKK